MTLRRLAMTPHNVVHIKDINAQKALDSLNRITGLKWRSLPVSLVAEGLVINDEKQEAYAPQRRRA